MKYTKSALSFEEQADLLLHRGLAAERSDLLARLQMVNYYRLSGYWYPFRDKDEQFKPNTNFTNVWRRYVFDRRFRLIVMDAIERVEVAIRTAVIYQFAREYGPFEYVDAGNFPNLDTDRHQKMLRKLKREEARSKEQFAKHFRKKYGDEHKEFPLWMIAELMTFGSLMTFFDGVSAKIKQKIAEPYRVPDKVLLSWLRSLNSIRNTCAHHGRLWNRELGYKPMIPKEQKYPEWHMPVEVENNRVFGTIVILNYMMDVIAPQSKWLDRLYSLLEEYNDIPTIPMGFPENWKECPILKGSTK